MSKIQVDSRVRGISNFPIVYENPSNCGFLIGILRKIKNFQILTIFLKIGLLSETIRELDQRIRDLENRLIDENLPKQHKNTVERELDEIKKLLETNMKTLDSLRKKENKYLYITVFVFISFLIFGIYKMYFE